MVCNRGHSVAHRVSLPVVVYSLTSNPITLDDLDVAGGQHTCTFIDTDRCTAIQVRLIMVPQRSPDGPEATHKHHENVSAP